MEAKACSRCRIVKPADEFNKRGKKLRAECRECQRSYFAERYAAAYAEKKRAEYPENREYEKARHQEWYIKNRDKIKAKQQAADYKARHSIYNRAYRERNKEKIQVYFRTRYQLTRDAWLQKNKRWQAANRGRIQVYGKMRYRRMRQWFADYQRARYAAFPEKFAAANRRRRARLRNAAGSHTAEQIKALHLYQKGRCPVCRSSLKHGYHVDHVNPLSKGGSDDISNIQLLCPPCNLNKSAKDPIEFMRERGYLL